MQVDQGSEFYNRPFKKWLKENHIKIHSTYNEGKSAVAGRFINEMLSLMKKIP